uniref:Phosphatidate cytidylyltransferase, mitochondrial n=1 Tax=Monodelphis domestica TaxID=13616 RepID=A0A5F8GN26_MONDO
ISLHTIPGSMATFRRILANFPYGSSVYHQSGTNSSRKNIILDLVFSVDDPVTWHSKNLQKNRNHYSCLRLFGPNVIAKVQNNFGAGIYYNAMIKCDGKLIKFVSFSKNNLLQAALDRNLKSAVTAAFLMLPESCSEEDLFVQIAELSYSCDFQMLMGEEKKKVVNIVKPNIPHFRELYCSILCKDPQVVYKGIQGRLEIDKSPEGQFT